MTMNYYTKPLKIKTTTTQDEKNILFWGCMHLDHDSNWNIPLWMTRGFSSVEQHNACLISRWNHFSDKNTVGFLLGDTMFGYGGAKKFNTFLSQMNFKELYIMPGNHTAGFSQAIQMSSDYYLNEHQRIILVPNYIELYVERQPIVLCHYPILSWNGMAKGSWMLYSHVHGALSRSEIGKMYEDLGARNYEVSVEKNPEPITFHTLKYMLNSRDIAKIDHHAETENTPFSRTIKNQ